LISFYIKLVY